MYFCKFKSQKLFAKAFTLLNKIKDSFGIDFFMYLVSSLKKKKVLFVSCHLQQIGICTYVDSLSQSQFPNSSLSSCLSCYKSCRITYIIRWICISFSFIGIYEHSAVYINVKINIAIKFFLNIFRVRRQKNFQRIQERARAVTLMLIE